MINMLNSFLKNTLAVFLTLAFIQAQAVQDVYEYKNKEGVTEFTDEVKVNKVPEKHTQIKKMTPEEEAKGQQKLDQIMEKDKALDERLAKERQLENKRRAEAQKQAQEAKKNEGQDDDNGRRRYRDNVYGPYPIRPGIPNNPNRPGKPVQLPARR